MERDLVLSWLLDKGVARVPHPGGTLLDHLVRVESMLRNWELGPDVQVAGLCHATFGTAGFDTALLSIDERDVLRALIGERSEELVYLYGSCDRAATYPQFQPDSTEPVPVVNRLTGASTPTTAADLTAFCAITIANELDVIAHSKQVDGAFRIWLVDLSTAMAPWLPPVAVDACHTMLAT